MRIDLSIVILIYNARDYLEKALHSIKVSKVSFNYEVILVDNCSTDGSRELVSKLAKAGNTLKAVLNTKNSGFSSGNNNGIKHAKGRYALFLNPDTILSPSALQKSYDYMENNPDVGIVGGNLHLESGELDSASHRGFPTPGNAISQFIGLLNLFPKSHLFAGYSQGWNLDNHAPHEVDAISGAYFFVRREVGKEVGWWDTDYFMYGEDIDFCYRVKKLGWKVVFLPGVHVLHYGGVSAGIRKHIRAKSQASIETRMRSAKASTQAMRIFYNKHYKNKYPQWMTNIVLLGVDVLERIRTWRVV